MTEAEWLSEQHDSQGMVFSLRGTRVTRTKAGKRKLRLFACACCRLTWKLLTDPLLRQAVEVAERFSESQAGKDELGRAYESARRMLRARTPGGPNHRESAERLGVTRQAVQQRLARAAGADRPEGK